MRRIAIAIAGASCSGKTTLARALAERLDATLVRVDDYYKPLDDLTYDERCDSNFDHPCTIDQDRLVADVRSLLVGEAIEMPRYDFTRHTRFAQGETVTPGRYVIVEGLFTLCYPALAEICAVRVFVDAPEDVCLQRRIVRDVEERGRTPGEVVSRFESHVAPMYREHVLPSAARANVRVCGIGSVEAGREGVIAVLPPQELAYV